MAQIAFVSVLNRFHYYIDTLYGELSLLIQGFRKLFYYLLMMVKHADGLFRVIRLSITQSCMAFPFTDCGVSTQNVTNASDIQIGWSR